MKRHFFTHVILAFIGIFSFREMYGQIAVCHPSITKNTPPSGCMASITFSDIDDGSTDFDTYSISQTQFIGPDTFQVELTVMKNSGQSSTCTSTLYVVDKTNPVPVVRNDLFVKMDSSNLANLTPEMFDLGSYDYCSEITSMTVTPAQVSCTDISPLQVVLTVYDGSGNSAFATTQVRLSNASNNTSVMACNDEIMVKLNPGESKKMYPYEILEGGPYKCWEEYSLDILENNIPFPDDFVRYQDINKNLIVKITDNATQNACWGILKVKAEICDVLIICDTESRCAPLGDCSSGHSLDDDVEWPCDKVIVSVPMEVYINPSPEVLAEFMQQDVDEFRPVFYNDNDLCANEVASSYADQVFNIQQGKIIHRTWTILHWPTNVTASYLQVIQLGEISALQCDICDTLAWDTPITGCQNGHSSMDAIEWPANFSIDGMRISPTDLWYEDSFNKSNAMPWIREECKSLIEVIYNDSNSYISSDSILIKRVWKVFHKSHGEFYTFTQNIIATNTPSDDAKVCIRRRNGSPMSDVNIFPDVNMEIGPCKEFTLSPAHTILKPQKMDTDYVGGVDLSDLILLYEHILGIRQLDALQQAAGDFNGNNGLSTLDVVSLTRMIEGESVNLSYWPSPWKFGYQYLYFAPNQYFANQINVYPGFPQIYGHHFVAYKLGDINDSYEGPSNSPLQVTMNDEIVTKGEKYVIPLLASKDMNMKGVQLKIKKNPGIDILSVNSDIFSIHQSTIKDDYFSYLGFEREGSAHQIKKGDVICTIEIEALKNDVLHNLISFLEGDHQKIIRDDYQSIPFDLDIEGLITVGTKNQTLVNVQVQPNPVNDVLTIQHDLEGPVSVTVFSSTGQRVMAQETFNSTLPVSGLLPAMYFLQISDQSGKTGYTTFIKN